MIPYNNVASDYLLRRYFPGNLEAANLAMSIPDTLAMFLIPALGMYVDRCGRRVDIILLGAVGFIVGHLALALGAGKLMALLALCILGCGYSTLLCFWACVPSLVRPLHHSTAYGVLTSACNLSVTVVPLAIASLISSDPTYRSTGSFFALMAVAALVLGMFFALLNVQRRLGLNCAPPPSALLPMATSHPLVGDGSVGLPPPLTNSSSDSDLDMFAAFGPERATDDITVTVVLGSPEGPPGGERQCSPRGEEGTHLLAMMPILTARGSNHSRDRRFGRHRPLRDL